MNKKIFPLLFFLLAWLWASWWMGDVMRIAYERSFIAADATLMLWLWQKFLGWLWILGRALLALYRWPVVGGLFVAAMLTVGSWLVGVCLRLPQRWRWVQNLPAVCWMTWTAKEGLNLFYMNEPGRILGVPFLVLVILAVLAGIEKRLSPRPPYQGGSGHCSGTENKQRSISKVFTPSLIGRAGGESFLIFLCFALPAYYLNYCHPYLRPLTKMQVQLLNDDFEGISRTAHEHAEMSYRPMAGFYAIALARTGHLADQLFDIKLEFDSLHTYGRNGEPNECMNYHIIDCNYYAGLVRASRHYAVEDLTMNGPSLFNLKYMVKISLVEGDWALAQKYLHVLRQAPFEGAFIEKYEPMVGHPDRVQADPEFAAVIKMLPTYHTLEQMHVKPGFLGYYVDLREFQNPEAMEWSAVACLYAKRMPSFLQRCKGYLGSMPPRSIAEGLIIKAYSEPAILQAFPQLELGINRYELFMQDAMPYMEDRERGGEVLFEKYKGYYPYYYFFGNLRSTRSPNEEQGHNRAGVN